MITVCPALPRRRARGRDRAAGAALAPGADRAAAPDAAALRTPNDVLTVTSDEVVRDEQYIYRSILQGS